MDFEPSAKVKELQKRLQHFMDEALFAFEIMIKLALPGPGNFNDFIRAGTADSLFVEQVGGGPNDPESRLRTPRKSRFHSLLFIVPVGTRTKRVAR